MAKSVIRSIVVAVAEAAVAHGAPREEVPDGERLPIEVLYGLWVRTVEVTGLPALPIRVGANARFDRYGALGIALYVSHDNETALRRLVRYHDLLTDSGEWRLTIEGDRVIVRWHRADDGPGAHLANEQVLASFATVLRQITDASTILEVRLRHAPQSIGEHERHFKAPVVASANEDAIILPAAMLREKPRAADPFVERFIVAEIAKAAAGSEPDDPVSRVGRVMIELLPDGAPTIEPVAARLEVSPRTLRRRLADAGTSFEQLLVDLRRERALTLLAGGYAVTEIARAVGFADTSAFSRAFKRWTGRRPSDLRRKVD